MEISQNLITRGREYLSWDPCPETREVIRAMIEENNYEALEPLLLKRLAFGTAGLRGPMGAGYSRMNDLVVMQTSQGLAAYLELQLGEEEAKSRGIVIGYDHRKLNSISSKGLARICAAVFLTRGYRVYLLENLVATPLVPFGTTNLRAAAGIMVTASHNPKTDNGFKVYWGNGSQIIPPHDQGIADQIDLNLSPWQLYDTSCHAVLSNPLAEDLTERISGNYYEQLKSLCQRFDKNTESKLPVVYTAMHGVGAKWVHRAFVEFGHTPPLSVPSQEQPDPEFSTVSFPNPEEKGALDQAIAFAESQRVSLIIANDPDADRLAVCERLFPFPEAEGDSEVDSKSNWYQFTGNEIGVLLGHWQITRSGTSKSDEAEEGYDVDSTVSCKKLKLARKAVLASIVSSRMLKSIAEREGVEYYDTLTGFKWLGNKSLELQSQEVDVLFAYEEALGYCIGNVVCDKDGISAASVFVEMAAALREQGLTVKQHFQNICAKYGEFVSVNSYVLSYDTSVTQKIFSRLRTAGPSGGYWQECGGVRILSTKDITLGYDSAAENNICSIPATPDSEMIMFEFENCCSITLRTSGTEPKIKYYTELAGKPGEKRDVLIQRLTDFVETVVDEMLQPAINGLARSS